MPRHILGQVAWLALLRRAFLLSPLRGKKFSFLVVIGIASDQGL